MMRYFVLVLIVTIAFDGCMEKANGAKILAVMPIPSFSHQIFLRPLWIELAKRGHEVTLITTDPINDKTLTNLREIDVSMVYETCDANFHEVILGLAMKESKLEELGLVVNHILNATKKELLHPEVQELFMNTSIHFDLLMIENVLPIMFVFKHRFDVPLIGVASMDMFRSAHAAVGNPIHSVLYPVPLIPFEIGLSFGERLSAFMLDIVLTYNQNHVLVPIMDEMIRETLNCTGDEFPSVAELEKRVDMIFINANPMFSTKRPFSPATISLAGGLHTGTRSSPNTMSQELLNFLNESDEGVIYFSLGTNIKSKFLPEQLRKVFIETFSKLPYKVLWKFELENLDGKPDNVKILKWLPQQEVLRHKNIKLFVSQGGLQSLEESLLAGVPVITIPFFGDQESNSHRVEANGLGLQLSHKTLTADLFESTILEVARNTTYAETVKRHAAIILDQPRHPLDNAVWWTEYVLRHKGAQHLKGPTIPDYQYYHIDILGFLSLIVGAILCIFYYIARFIFGKLCAKFKKVTRVKKTN